MLDELRLGVGARAVGGVLHRAFDHLLRIFTGLNPRLPRLKGIGLAGTGAFWVDAPELSELFRRKIYRCLRQCF